MHQNDNRASHFPSDFDRARRDTTPKKTSSAPDLGPAEDFTLVQAPHTPELRESYHDQDVHKVQGIKLSVVIPCYNESRTIEDVLDAVQKHSPVLDTEIIVVDDCSEDGCAELLKSQPLQEKADKIIFHDKNQGKGAALRTGFLATSGDVIVIQDADLEYDPVEFIKLLTPILNNDADIVYGSRFAGQTQRKGYSLSYLANRFLTALSNYCSGTKITDMETCYKMFRREALENISIKEDRFGFEPEITAKLAQAGYSICEVPITYFPRTFSEGKKIGWRDALRAIYCILKYNFASPSKTPEESLTSQL